MITFTALKCEVQFLLKSGKDQQLFFLYKTILPNEQHVEKSNLVVRPHHIYD